MSKLSYLSEFQNHLLRPPHYFAFHVNFFYFRRHFTEFFLDALRVTPGGVGLLTGSWTPSPVELSPQCRCLLGWPIASARSSGTDDYLTVCSTVLRGSSGTCQLLLRCVSVITNRESCTDSYMMTPGNWDDPYHFFRSHWSSIAI